MGLEVISISRVTFLFLVFLFFCLLKYMIPGGYMPFVYNYLVFIEKANAGQTSHICCTNYCWNKSFGLNPVRCYMMKCSFFYLFILKPWTHFISHLMHEFSTTQILKYFRLVVVNTAASQQKCSVMNLRSLNIYMSGILIFLHCLCNLQIHAFCAYWQIKVAIPYIINKKSWWK